MELSAAKGPADVAVDIRKRFASLRRSISYVDWSKQRALIKDLRGLLGMIEATIAPQDADEAFELLWSFLQLALSNHQRTDDSNAAVGDVMGTAMEMIDKLFAKISVDPRTLAERVLHAVADADYGEFDGIIPAMSEVLGQDSLEHLKQITMHGRQRPLLTMSWLDTRALACRPRPETAFAASGRSHDRSSWRMLPTPRGMLTPTWPAIPLNN